MLIFAALLLILLGVFHSVVGERLILQRIKEANNLPEIWGSKTATFRTIQATWHLVSVLWVALAVCLLLIASNNESFVKLFLILYGTVFGMLALVPLIWNSGNHKTWILFAFISGLLFSSVLLEAR